MLDVVLGTILNTKTDDMPSGVVDNSWVRGAKCRGTRFKNTFITQERFHKNTVAKIAIKSKFASRTITE
jgi:hypothetical protein